MGLNLSAIEHLTGLSKIIPLIFNEILFTFFFVFAFNRIVFNIE